MRFVFDLLPEEWGLRKPKRLVRNEFLDPHAVIDVSDIDGTVSADGKIMTPIDLAVIIAIAAPFRKDFAGEVKLKNLPAVWGSRF